MRHLLAILLLLVAAAHPLAHIGDELVACPCVHGAVVDVAPPALADEAAKPFEYAATLPAYIPAAAATELPARAPPAA